LSGFQHTNPDSPENETDCPREVAEVVLAGVLEVYRRAGWTVSARWRGVRFVNRSVWLTFEVEAR
jgi:hypothetical protein